MGIVSRFGAWIDKKFPDKVYVDAALFTAIKEDIKTLALAMDAQNARIDAIAKKQELIERKPFVSQADR